MPRGSLLAPFSREYQVSDIEETGTITYVLFIAVDGRWYILKYDSSDESIRYKSGSQNPTAGWTGRAGWTYKRFNEEFS